MNRRSETVAWQTMLDKHGHLFADLRTGSRIGITRRADLIMGCADMIVFEARKGKLIALEQQSSGFEDPSLDVMLVGDDEAFDEVTSHFADDRLAALKRQVKAGGFACHLMRVECDLIEAGYENVLSSLGVAFLGACR